MGKAIYIYCSAFDSTVLLAAAFDDCKFHYFYSPVSLRRGACG